MKGRKRNRGCDQESGGSSSVKGLLYGILHGGWAWSSESNTAGVVAINGGNRGGIVLLKRHG